MPLLIDSLPSVGPTVLDANGEGARSEDPGQVGRLLSGEIPLYLSVSGDLLPDSRGRLNLPVEEYRQMFAHVVAGYLGEPPRSCRIKGERNDISEAPLSYTSRSYPLAGEQRFLLQNIPIPFGAVSYLGAVGDILRRGCIGVSHPGRSVSVGHQLELQPAHPFDDVERLG